MRWLTFAICAVIVITLQASIAPRLEWRGVRPDWVLVLVVFFALNGRSIDVLLGAWILGALVDLLTLPSTIGLYSLSYSLAALVVYSVREYLFREHAITYVAVTFVIGLVLQFVWGVNRMITLPSEAGAFAVVIREPVTAAVMTALWAIPAHIVLLPFNRALGLMSARSRRNRSWLGRRRRSRF
jgi:rod shape-determining protein MreD